MDSTIPEAAVTVAPVATPPDPSQPDPPTSRRGSWNETKTDLKWAGALLFVLLLVFPIVGRPLLNLFNLPSDPWPAWREPTAGTEDLDAVTDLIFATDGLVAPFEILSALLLAALIAGVVVALRERDDAEEGW